MMAAPLHHWYRIRITRFKTDRVIIYIVEQNNNWTSIIRLNYTVVYYSEEENTILSELEIEVLKWIL